MDPIVRLKGARVGLTATYSEKLNLDIRRGRILSFESRVPPSVEIDLSGHLILPGLINAHDHLEFNLFPRLGRGPYTNASEWASDIYKPDVPPLKEHLLVKKETRLVWGGIKNLLSGVTTVAHHNPWEPQAFGKTFPVRVVRRFGWAHSLKFSPDVVDLHRRTPVRWPFIIHAAEGTDETARAEIAQLDELGVLGRRTIVVHAVGAGVPEFDAIGKRAASVIWCPSSNLFTLGRTLTAEALRSGVLMALGTDSAMTAEGDLIDEMRVASTTAGLTNEELYGLVTTNAARALRLAEGQGMIREKGLADLLAVKDDGQTPAEALLKLRPELVWVGGRMMLASGEFTKLTTKDFHPIAVEGRGCWLVRANVPRLRVATVSALGTDIRLAGRLVCG